MVSSRAAMSLCGVLLVLLGEVSLPFLFLFSLFSLARFRRLTTVLLVMSMTWTPVGHTAAK